MPLISKEMPKVYKDSLIFCLTELSQLIVTHNVPSEVVSKWCEKANVEKVEDFPEEIKLNCISHILHKYQQVVTPEEIREVA